MNDALMTNQMASLLYKLEDAMFIISQKKKKRKQRSKSLIGQTTEQFATQP